ncbi:hypothetical protein [Litoribacillus peritrichatus]|uniref:Uncharacterized protein n=1 Tax=Litoribacillus peritrichatus TaxID=718191 RepID=A0ABP7MF52_9GAMM
MTSSATQLTLTSDPVELGQWYTVTGQYRAGQLKLTVLAGNGVETLSQQSQPLSGVIDYGSGDLTLELGDNYTGLMQGVEFFDWNRKPLVTFDDDSLVKQIQLDASGVAKVAVKSTGVYGDSSVSPEAKSALFQKIPLVMNDIQNPTEKSTGYISLTTESAYQVMAEQYTSNAPIPENAQIAYLYNTNPTSQFDLFFISKAHAAGDWVPTLDELEEMAKEAADAVAEAATWVVPYDDMITIAEQLEYRKTNSSEYNPMLLAASSLSVLSVIPTPFTKVLKPIMKPIKAVAKVVGKGKFGQAFSNKFLELARACVADKGKGSACDKLESLLPFLEIIGYMYIADPEGFTEMVQSVASEDDFITLFEFLTMDIDPSWFGLDDNPITQVMPSPTPYLQWMGISTAYAKTSTSLIKEFGKSFLRVLSNLSKKV